MPHPTFTRFPSNTRIKGVNLTFRPSDSSSETFFGGSFGGGGQTFDLTWFEGQMDVAVAMGCNTVRIFGAWMDVPVSATYLSRWDDILDEAASRNLYVIVTGAHVAQLEDFCDGSNVVTSAARTWMVNHYNTVRAHSNVIAFDPIQESYGWTVWSQGTEIHELRQPNITAAELLAVQAAIYGDLKAESTAIPITWSGYQDDFLTKAAFRQDFTARNNALAYMDYLDFHVYYSLSAGDLAPAYQWAGNKSIIIGEFGEPLDTSPTIGDGCDYAQMRRVVESTQIDGILCWAAKDHSTIDSDSWGVAEDDGTLRANGTTFAGITTALQKSVSIFAVGGTRAAA